MSGIKHSIEIDEDIMFVSVASPYFLAFCRVVIGLVFGLSSLSKVRNVAQFTQTIRAFALLPSKLSSAAAVLFLCGEFAVVVLMLSGGPLLLPGFFLAGGLLLLFSLALSSVVARSIQTSCNCFGPSTKPISRLEVWRNLGLVLCTLEGWASLTWTQAAQISLGLLDWVLIGLSAAVFVGIWTQLGEILHLFRQS